MNCFALRVIIVGALCVGAFLASAPSDVHEPAGAAFGSLALSLRPEKIAVHLGDPLWVTAELRNVSGRTQRIYDRAVSFTIVARKTAQYVPPDPDVNSGAPVATLKLAPRTSTYTRFRLDTSYQLRAPGTYSAIATSARSPGLGKYPVMLKSSPIAITVLPKTERASPLPVETPAVEVTLQTDRPAYGLGQPIFVRFSVRNITEDEINYIGARIDVDGGCSLIIVDGQGNPIGPPRGFGPPFAGTENGLPPSPFAAHKTMVFGFLHDTANLERWGGYTVASPGSYAIAAFSSHGWWISSSPPVRFRVLSRRAAEEVPGSALNDAQLNRSVAVLLNRYREVLSKSSAMISRVRSTADTNGPYFELRSATEGEGEGGGQLSIGDSLERLPVVGLPVSPYINVGANFLESLRHVSAAADAMDAMGLLPSNAPLQGTRAAPPPPAAGLKSRLGIVISVTPPPTPRPIPIPRCKLATVISELSVAEYFYNAVKSEMQRGYARLSDSISPPAVRPISSECH